MADCLEVVADPQGVLVISLDFELYWGMRDIVRLEDYRDYFLGERRVIPRLLNLFDDYQVHATWATVGFLFFQTRDELISAFPDRKPNYADRKLFPYDYVKAIGSCEAEDPFHYAPSLIKLIASSPNQEIGSHTFSHYYCLENGQDVGTFRDDLLAAVKAAKRYGLRLESLVFPRNQFNSDYLSVCRELEIRAYRGNPCSWIYSAGRGDEESLRKRGLRLLDAYLNLSG